MTVRPDSPHVARHQNREYRFCSARCREKFAADPAGYLEPREAALAAAPPGATYTCPMHPEIIRDRPGSCPLCGMALDWLELAFTAPVVLWAGWPFFQRWACSRSATAARTCGR
jgi:Cu+-exporting ATPase